MRWSCWSRVDCSEVLLNLLVFEADYTCCEVVSLFVRELVPEHVLDDVPAGWEEAGALLKFIAEMLSCCALLEGMFHVVDTVRLAREGGRGSGSEPC